LLEPIGRTMDYKQFSDIKTKIEMELDLETEDFIQPNEFIGFVNDAIAQAEQQIHKLGLEDEYFLTKTQVSLVAGQADYNLPADVYSNKLKRIIYQVGTTIYDVVRFRSKDRFLEKALRDQYGGTTQYYKYELRNDGPGSSTQKPVFELSPASQETTSNALTVWYYRAANKWALTDTNGDGYCDLPESAAQFVFAYTRYRCYDKEGHPNTPEAKDAMMTARQDMIDVLTNMVPDEESSIDKDVSLYEDFS